MHINFFKRSGSCTIVHSDLYHFHSPCYRKISYKEFPQVIHALLENQSPAAQARADNSYNMIGGCAGGDGLSCLLQYGCWYYNFRGIPHVLEEGQELWGVNVFKRGFGGYPLMFLETHDLVYSPLVYGAYTRLLEVKRKRDERVRRKIEVKRKEAERIGTL